MVVAQKSKTKASEREIITTISNEKGSLNALFNECVGAGRVNEGLRADWQQQLAYVKNECGFEYLHMHGLLTEDMVVYKEARDGNPVYSYLYVDALFDFLLTTGIKPFVDLYRPIQLTKQRVEQIKKLNKWCSCFYHYSQSEDRNFVFKGV
jgi:xylan 1,4-beta-xylosidase